MNLAVVLGTRPEILKLAPVVRECERRGVDFSLIHTGQHYSQELDAVFFEALGLPTPEFNLGVGSASHGRQTGLLLVGIESVLLGGDFDAVVVQGDTNSVLAGALAASKLDVALAHVEAGLRSFDRRMPEEINRVVTDHVSDYLFAPTEEARALLRREGIPAERIYVTGNTVVDAVLQNRPLADARSAVLDEQGLRGTEFFLVTAHRAENVDDPTRFAGILDGVSRFAAERGSTAIYPIHPRARKQLDAFGLEVPPEIRLLDPLEYVDFLALEDAAAVVFTDSGGVQEEACILGTPCVTVRDNTERPETVAVGANVVAGVEPADIVAAARRMRRIDGGWENPLGDGTAGRRIVDVLLAEGSDDASDAFEPPRLTETRAND